MPDRWEGDYGREIVRGTFPENTPCGRACGGVVELPERFDQQNVKNVPGARRSRLRGSAGVQFLGDLLAEADAPHRRGYRNAQFAKSLDGWGHQIHAGRADGTEIHLDGLPRAGPVLNRNLDPHRIGEIHLTNGGFDPEG